MWRRALRPERQPRHAGLPQSDAAEVEEIAPVHNRTALLERDSACIVSRGKRRTQAPLGIPGKLQPTGKLGRLTGKRFWSRAFPSRRSSMKLSRGAFAIVSLAACCAGVWALQRTGNFGFGNDDSATNVKAEFYWSRLAYSSSMQNFGGGLGGGFGRRGWF